MIVKKLSKAGSKNLEHRPNKRVTYALQKQITRKHYDIKGTSQATKLYTYRDNNKDRNETINSREMSRTSEK